MTVIAEARSATLNRRGVKEPSGTPSARSPFRTRAGTWVSGLVPRLIAFTGSPRSRASRANQAMATTLLTVPCSHTKTTVGESTGAAREEDWPIVTAGLEARTKAKQARTAVRMVIE